MRFGKVEILIAPNIYFLILFGVLMMVDWRWGVAFVGVSIIAGFIGWWLKYRLHPDESREYTPWFRCTPQGYVPVVIFRGIKSHRKRGVALELKGCFFKSPDEAIAEASVIAQASNQKPLHSP